MLKKFSTICSSSFLVLFFENNLIKNKIIKTKSPIGISIVLKKESIKTIGIKKLNCSAQEYRIIKPAIGIKIKIKSAIVTHLKILSILFIA